MKNAFDLAREAIANLPPAISGQGGHPATFRAACECARLGLGDGDAMSLLAEFNRRCSPPWSEKELRHKLTDARRAAGGQVRRWHQQAAPAVRMVWKSVKSQSDTLPKSQNDTSAKDTATKNKGVKVTHLNIAEAGSKSQSDTCLAIRKLKAPEMPDFAGLLPDAPHLAGWHRNSTPIFQGTAADWREHFTDKE